MTVNHYHTLCQTCLVKKLNEKSHIYVFWMVQACRQKAAEAVWVVVHSEAAALNIMIRTAKEHS